MRGHSSRNEPGDVERTQSTLLQPVWHKRHQRQPAVRAILNFWCDDLLNGYLPSPVALFGHQCWPHHSSLVAGLAEQTGLLEAKRYVAVPERLLLAKGRVGRSQPAAATIAPNSRHCCRQAAAASGHDEEHDSFPAWRAFRFSVRLPHATHKARAFDAGGWLSTTHWG